MSLFTLALRNLAGMAARSRIIFLCALVVSGFALSTLLIIRGAESSLTLANQRLGADVLVLPKGMGARVETALLMGKPTTAWMPRDYIDQIARIPGVERVSPQLYLGTMVDSPCCAVSDMFMIAFDPRTDFTVSPWLIERLGRSLAIDEVVGGTFVFTPAGDTDIEIYGSRVRLQGNLEPTGTGLDQTMFLTFDSAYDIARRSAQKAVMPLDIPEDSISAALVHARPDVSVQSVALAIADEIQNVDAIPSPDLFLAYRRQIEGLVTLVVGVLSFALILAMVLIGLAFSMAVNERRKEIGVMRALGASRRAVLLSLLGEVNLLGLAGGVIGLALAALAVYLFRNLLVDTLGMPFFLPAMPVLIVEVLVILAAALICVSLSALWPAWRISRQEPSLSMRD